MTSLAQNGHEVYFLRLEKGLHMLEDRPLPNEIQQVEWKGGRNRLTLVNQLLLLGDLRRVLHQLKPDLVQAGPIQRSSLLIALTGFHPLVSMSWGYDLLHDANLNPLWRWATRYTLHHTDCLVGDCNTIRQLAIHYGMPDERIVTFPWGIDINHFNVQSNGQTFKRLHGRTFNLLSTRAFEPIYGVDVIARAFVLAARQYPELHLTLLGAGSQEAALRQVFLVGNVYNRVDFIGKVGYDELPAYYRNADVYLSASHSDGSSISLLEAFACGTPAIVSDIPGNREWVTPGENGWLFQDGNAHALYETILDALSKRQSLDEMGKKSRLLAETKADWVKNFPMLEKAYACAVNHQTHPGVLAQ